MIELEMNPFEAVAAAPLGRRAWRVVLVLLFAGLISWLLLWAGKRAATAKISAPVSAFDSDGWGFPVQFRRLR